MKQRKVPVSPFFKRILVLIAFSLLSPLALMAQTLTLAPASQNFGSTPVGTGTAWFTFILANGGGSAVSISNVNASGPFVVSSNCGSSVAANSSCPIYVYFAPTSSGPASGTLSVADSASNSPQTSALSGTGGSGGSCTAAPSANWIGSVRHDQFQHKPELERRDSTSRVRCEL